jgi:hypothetical protein
MIGYFLNRPEPSIEQHSPERLRTLPTAIVVAKIAASLQKYSEHQCLQGDGDQFQNRCEVKLDLRGAGKTPCISSPQTFDQVPANNSALKAELRAGKKLFGRNSGWRCNLARNETRPVMPRPIRRRDKASCQRFRPHTLGNLPSL